MKKLLKSTLYRKSYSITNVDIAHFTSCHHIMPRFLPSLFRHFSIAHTIHRIMMYILVQELTSTDWYWRSYGSAKFDTAMASFEAKLRRAITSSIIRFSRHIMYQNVDNTTIYHHGKRGDEILTSQYWTRQKTCEDSCFQLQNYVLHNFVYTWPSTAIFAFYCR